MIFLLKTQYYDDEKKKHVTSDVAKEKSHCYDTQKILDNL